MSNYVVIEWNENDRPGGCPISRSLPIHPTNGQTAMEAATTVAEQQEGHGTVKVFEQSELLESKLLGEIPF